MRKKIRKLDQFGRYNIQIIGKNRGANYQEIIQEQFPVLKDEHLTQRTKIDHTKAYHGDISKHLEYKENLQDSTERKSDHIQRNQASFEFFFTINQKLDGNGTRPLKSEEK